MKSLEKETTEIGKNQKNAMHVVLCTTCFLLAFLSTALNTAQPNIANDFNVSASVAQWTVSGYALALAIVMPLTAFLVKRFSSRTLYLLALVLYFACSVICASSQLFGAFIVARVVQACANGIIASLTQVSILSIFPKDEQGRRMGWFGLSVGVAPVFAPALGGLLVDAWGWRSIFWICAALFFFDALVSFGVMKKVLDISLKRFDASGFIASAIGLGGITLGVGNISSMGITSASTLMPLTGGILAIALFVKHELSCEDPLLQLRVFSKRQYRASVLASASLYAVMMGSAAVLPIFVQSELNATAAVAGLIVLPGAAAMALVNPLAGKALDKYGVRKLAGISCSLLIAGNALACIPSFTYSLEAQTVLAIMRYCAIGMVQMPFMVWGNKCIPTEDLASGTALLTCIRNVAGAAGVAVFVGLLATSGVVAAYIGMTVVSLGVLLPIFASKR